MSRKTAFGAATVVLAAALGVFLSRAPWIAYREQKLKAEAATQEMREAEAAKAQLVRQKAKLESPMGREQLARQRNWLKPGEEPLEKDN